MINKKKLITWGLFFLVFFTIAQFFTKQETGTTPQAQGAELIVTASKAEYASGTEVIVEIRNNTAATVTFPSNCPKNPFRVLAWNGEIFEERTSETSLSCDRIAGELTIPAGKEINVSYTNWNYSLFGQPGRYKVQVDLAFAEGIDTFTSPEFTVVEPALWRKFFRNFFYRPLYNVLVFFIGIAPLRDLGFAIILLTIVIRLILLVPSQRAIVSQRRMQELQPKLEHIKKKYAGNQERIAQETMKLWKENKVNPFGSCLPILIQFPVLIALFYVIRNGLNPDNIYLIYNPLSHIDLSNIHTNFLGILDLTRINTFVLPLIVGALQFFQLKLAMFKKKTSAGEKGSQMAMANKTMIYVMPVMIAIFTASVPAGVGLYWGVSTLFALGQQIVANRKPAL